MLEIVVVRPDMWDETKEEFVESKEWTLKLEHSLVSLSKWESKWCKPFLSKEPKTNEETLDYIRCMTLNKRVDSEVYSYISNDNIADVNRYIEAPMTATTFSKTDERGVKEQVTAELVYYWMITLNIPFDCRKWHFNSLLTLIRVCNVKNAPPKKMSRQDISNRYRAINEANRKRFNSKG